MAEPPLGRAQVVRTTLEKSALLFLYLLKCRVQLECLLADWSLLAGEAGVAEGAEEARDGGAALPQPEPALPRQLQVTGARLGGRTITWWSCCSSPSRGRQDRCYVTTAVLCAAGLAVADGDDGGGGVAAGAELPRHLHQPGTTVSSWMTSGLWPTFSMSACCTTGWLSGLSRDLGSPPAVQLFISLRMCCDIL